MTFLFSIAIAVFQQFEFIWANYLNMELQMENVASKLFHSQPFSLALLASRCAAFFFPHLRRHWGFRARGCSAPSGHAASQMKSVTFQPEDSTPSTSACAPSLCSPPRADTQVRDAETHPPWPTRESTCLESHCEWWAVTPEQRDHWVSIINLKLTLSWPSIAKYTNL